MPLTAAQRNLHARVAGCLSAEIGPMCGPGLAASSGTCMAGGVSFREIDYVPATIKGVDVFSLIGVQQIFRTLQLSSACSKFRTLIYLRVH